MTCTALTIYSYRFDAQGNEIRCSCKTCKRLNQLTNPSRPFESEIDGKNGLFAELKERMRETVQIRDRENEHMLNEEIRELIK